jgi:GNAT superfamily N-acetyltransferase
MLLTLSTAPDSTDQVPRSDPQLITGVTIDDMVDRRTESRSSTGAITLRPARPDEAGTISALALRSKGHWGYDTEFLAACRADLTVDPAWCDGVRLIVAERDGEILGYSRISGDAPMGELDGLFVDPSAIGTGLGATLLRNAAAGAVSLGMQRLSIESDPHAEAFYRHAGAVPVGRAESTVIPGRTLPRLELDLTGFPSGR